MNPLDPTIHRTPVAACPACAALRRHNNDERNQHHPLSGHGFSDSHGAMARQEAERRLLALQTGAQEGSQS
jgi:hypothetical protein